MAPLHMKKYLSVLIMLGILPGGARVATAQDAPMSITDYLGAKSETRKAPSLGLAPLAGSFNQKLTDYPFPAQNVKATMLLARFPEFRLGSHVLVAAGLPLYTDDRYNLQKSRGPLVTDRSDQLPGQNGTNSFFFWSDALFTHAADVSMDPSYTLEQRRQAADFSGIEGYQRAGLKIPAEVKDAIHTFNGGKDVHAFPTDREVSLAVGRKCYPEWVSQKVIPLWNIPDVEVLGIPEGSKGDWIALDTEFVSGVMQGMVDAYKADVKNPRRPSYTPRWITYGVWSFNVAFSSPEACAKDDKGFPKFYTATPAYMTSDRRMTPLKDGFISMDSYLKTVWSEDEDFFIRDDRGRPKVENGRLVYNRANHTYDLCGRKVPVNGHEGEHLLHELYGNAGKMIAMLWHLNGEKYPEQTTSRKNGWETIGLAGWQRQTQEVGTYIATVAPFENIYNDRAIPRWELEGSTLVQMFLGRGHVRWSTGRPRHAPGADYDPAPNFVDYESDGAWEFYTKADHRASLVQDLFVSDGEWAFFNHPYLGNNSAEGERFTDKFIVAGKLYRYKNAACFGLVAYWPAQSRAEKTRVEVFLRNSGKTIGPYPFLLEGRETTLIRMKLPWGFENVKPSQVIIRYRDMLGVERIQCGDQRVSPPRDVTREQ